MGAHNGKFFSMEYTNKFFGDIQSGFDLFKSYALLHQDSQSEFSTSEAWIGADAVLGKMLVGVSDNNLVNEILNLQNEVIYLEDELLSLFKSMVEDSSDANIVYDDLEEIGNIFLDKEFTFKDFSMQVKSRVDTWRGQFSKYGSIREIDFDASLNSFAQLCGDGANVGGFIYECMQKLIQFDEAAAGLINGKQLIPQMDDLYDRLSLRVSFETDVEKLVRRIAENIDSNMRKMPGFTSFEELSVVTYLSTILPGYFKTGQSFGTGISNMFRAFGNTGSGTKAATVNCCNVGNIFTQKWNEWREWHYARNKNNDIPDDYHEVINVTYDRYGNPTVTVVEGSGWEEMSASESRYHKMTDGTQGAESQYNHKFIHKNPDGTSYEVVICVPPNDTEASKDPYIVTDEYNYGTYNYCSTDKTGGIKHVIEAYGGHAIYDVIPYWIFGNSETDSDPDNIIKRILGADAPKVSEVAHDVQQTASDAAQAVADTYNDIADQAVDAYNTAVDTAVDAYNSAVDTAVSTYEDVSDAVQTGYDNFVNGVNDFASDVEDTYTDITEFIFGN